MYLIGCILVTKPQAVITVATSISDISLITPYVTKPQAVITVATVKQIPNGYAILKLQNRKR